MSVFKRIPELDWLKAHAEAQMEGAEEALAVCAAPEEECEQAYQTGAQLLNLYRYLLWGRRYSLGHPQSPEGKVALGMLTKYHRRLYPTPLSAFERDMIADAEALRKRLLADAKKAKHGQA